MEKPAILIVDDEPDFTGALKATLVSKSYRVFIAKNRSQAESTVRMKRPDMVVLGTIAPRGDAFLFHQRLRLTPGFSDLPILVIDARREEEFIKGWTKDEGMQCEADDYLVKPIEPVALLPRIEKLLDKVTRRVRVLVVDDHTLVRQGICAILAIQRDIEVIGEAANGEEAVDMTIQLSPDVVLMDIVMPVMNGLEATKQICRECPQTKVLILTQYDDVENVVASSQAGALGFIPKTVASSQLLVGITTVSQGKRFMPATVS